MCTCDQYSLIGFVVFLMEQNKSFTKPDEGSLFRHRETIIFKTEYNDDEKYGLCSRSIKVKTGSFKFIAS